MIDETIGTMWYAGGLYFACRECGGCCAGPTEGYIWVTEPEIELIAKHLMSDSDGWYPITGLDKGFDRHARHELHLAKFCHFVRRQPDANCIVARSSALIGRNVGTSSHKSWRAAGVWPLSASRSISSIF